MRVRLFAVLGVSALALSACMSVDVDSYEHASASGAPLKTLAVLDCPASQGELTRTAQAADGLSCDYQGPVGEIVRLKLVALDGRSASDALAPMRAELRTLVPVATKPIPAISRDEPGEHTNVDMPFFHVHTVGDRADVKILGVTIHSEGKNADVATSHGAKHTVVHAGPDGAEVLTEEVNHTNASLVYVLAKDHGEPSGYAAVGYVAKGPANGPLVVGEFRATRKTMHSENRHGEHDDIDRLIDLNAKAE